MATAGQAVRHPDPLPVYGFCGDPFLRRRKMKHTLDSLIGPDREATIVTEFYATDATLSEVLDACRTASLWSSRNIVVVRDVTTKSREYPQGFLAAKYEKQRPRRSKTSRSRPQPVTVTYRKAIEDYLDAPEPATTLILEGDTFDRRWNLTKRIVAIGNLDKPETPKQYHLAAWIRGHAPSDHDCTIAADAAGRLADLVGTDLGRIDSELEKLATYVAPRRSIRVEDIDDLVGASREETVFKIIDAIVQQNPREALALWEQVQATDDKAEFRSVGGLAFAFRSLAQVKGNLERGLPLEDAAIRAGVNMKPTNKNWHLNRLQRQTSRFSARSWEDHLLKLLRIDSDKKVGVGSVRSAVEKLIIELCSAHRPRPAVAAART
ncbi:MAG: DNA polymerase III subunit delta [Phycisphaerae bacterium]